MKSSLGHQWNKVLRMEYLYNNYNFVVLDLPRFEIDDKEQFLEVWQKEHIDCGRLRTDIASPYVVDSTPRFKAIDIIDEHPERPKIWASKVYNMQGFLPKFYQQLHDILPFEKIDYVKLWQSIQNIRWHRDDTWWYVNFPSQVRILIYDENKTGTLGIMPETKPSDLKFINLPYSSNSFAWNNVRCLHGSYKLKNTEKILACISGPLDLNKYEKLLERSVVKYKDLASVTNNDEYTNLLLN